MSQMTALDRFREAQAQPGTGFDAALREIRAGRKTGHWIWYVLPQITGLGTSSLSHTFALRDVEEAADYLRDDELGDRLVTIVTAIADQCEARPGLRLSSLMGSEIDARKLVSSLTLFQHVAEQLDVSEGLERGATLAAVARAVLNVAAAQGYPPCTFTLSRLKGRRRRE
jgi:uncharacterized protein (DUF1810 family)